eukprot:13053499-Ditylum_brightwellii.AAC.1
MIKDTMFSLGYHLFKADPDLWLKKATTADSFEHYEYVLIYVDEILHITADTHPVMKTLA